MGRQPRIKRVLLLSVLFYLLPCVMTCCIQKRIPEDAEEAFSSGIFVFMNGDEGSGSLDLETYVLGVVMAQLQKDASPEMIKAQSVIVRTGVVQMVGEQKTIDGTKLGFPHIFKEELLKRWGPEYEEIYNKFSSAVTQTAGEILVFENDTQGNKSNKADSYKEILTWYYPEAVLDTIK